jgi:glycosyl transferase family 22 (putative mannosyltransferase)
VSKSTGELRYPAWVVFSQIKHDIFIFFSIAAVIYIVASIFGTTYFHPDQHYQTLEWADFKRTGANEDALPWEYTRAVRSWLLPYIYMNILDASEAIGITNPFMQDRVIRLLTAAFGLTTLMLFCVTTAWWLPLKGQRRLLVAIVPLTALLPNLMTRTGSETFSSIFMMLAFVALFLLRKNPEPVDANKRAEPFVGKMEFSTEGLILSGICIALAFDFRYQSGPAFLVLGFWMLLVARTRISQLLIFVFAVIIALALAMSLDTLGYGQFEFVPWNNIQANIFDGIAAKFGVEPWYFYFVVLSSNPIGASLVVALILFLLRFPLNLLNLFVWFFFIQHMLIDHKEARFVFPLIPFVIIMIPFLFPASWYGEKGDRLPLFGQNSLARLVGITFLVINTVGLYIVVFPTIKPIIRTQKFIIDNLPDEFEYYSLGTSPFRGFWDVFGPYRLRMEFYQPKSVVQNVIASPDELLNIRSDKPFYFIYQHSILPNTPEWEPVRANCELIYQTFDAKQLLRKPKDNAEDPQFSIYQCEIA